MGMQNSGKTSSGSNSSSFISTLVAKMPFTYRLLQSAVDQNPKYDIFNRLATRPAYKAREQSLFQQQPETSGVGDFAASDKYSRFIYADIDADKVRRVQEYRRMAAYAEVADCIDEIADEAIVKDNNGDVIKFALRSETHDKVVVKDLQKEWKKFIDVFDWENKGWEYIRQFLIEGELYFENVISLTRPDYGIINVVNIPTELINPVYDNIQNQIIEGFLFRKPILDLQRQSSSGQLKEEIIAFEKGQVSYINSGLWNEDRTVRLPYIENARRAYKQLSLVEDAIIIYRLVRAPERLVFKVDVGNMPVPKAEEYVRKLMQQYWSRKNFDASQNRVTNTYDPQSMLDAYWFTKRGQSEGTTVEQLPGGSNLGQLDDLMYFVRKLYKALKVPQQRLDPQNVFQDGEQITREELRFARFIIRVQCQIAAGIKSSFITHLKLREKIPDDDTTKSKWEVYKLRENHIHVEFNMPSSFAVIREQQIFDLKKNNFTGLVSTELMSQSYCQKQYLGMTTDQMAENREWLRKDAALSWEIQQIIANGPAFRAKLAAEIEMEKAAAGAATGGVPMGGTALPEQPETTPAPANDAPPDFGPGPETAAPAPQTPPANNAPPSN